MGESVENLRAHVAGAGYDWRLVDEPNELGIFHVLVERPDTSQGFEPAQMVRA